MAKPMTSPLPSRGALGWLSAALAGGMSALAFVIAFLHAESFLIFLMYLCAVPLMAVGLGVGLAAGCFAGIVGTVGAYLFLGNLTLTGVYFVIYALPSALLVWLALRRRVGGDEQTYWYPEGLLLSWTAVYPCVVFLALAAGFFGYENGLLGATAAMVKTGFETLPLPAQEDVAARMQYMIAVLPGILPMLAGASWFLVVMASLLGAQTMLAGQRWNLRPGFVWRTLRLPRALIVLAAISGLGAFVAPEFYAYLLSNVCMVLCLPIFCAGLMAVHAMAGRGNKTQRLLALVPFYVALSLFPPMAILVTLLGAIDQAFDFRTRLSKRTEIKTPDSKTQGENK